MLASANGGINPVWLTSHSVTYTHSLIHSLQYCGEASIVWYGNSSHCPFTSLTEGRLTCTVLGWYDVTIRYSLTDVGDEGPSDPIEREIVDLVDDLYCRWLEKYWSTERLMISINHWYGIDTAAVRCVVKAGVGARWACYLGIVLLSVCLMTFLWPDNAMLYRDYSVVLCQYWPIWYEK